MLVHVAPPDGSDRRKSWQSYTRLKHEPRPRTLGTSTSNQQSSLLTPPPAAAAAARTAITSPPTTTVRVRGLDVVFGGGRADLRYSGLKSVRQTKHKQRELFSGTTSVRRS